ncbi:MAG: PhnA domain-containing protein [Bacteroidetes bacterium]|nr:PhnA domain-containing protein [Bacteroidota bacterium]
MSINQELKNRNQELCELCNEENATIEYTVSPKNDDSIANQVALCNTCFNALDSKEDSFHWRCVEGSIWNQEPSVQALSYRILYNLKEEAWASDLISSVDLDENTIQWALSAYEKADVHTDAFGNILENGDNVVLTQALNVRGTNFTASKGTVVKKIKLVADNAEHIEGKINDQTIVILCKFVKKG